MAAWEHDLDTTLQKLSAKNERIRSRLKAQGVMDSGPKSHEPEANISRLSYTTFASQDFLSSTHISVDTGTKVKKHKIRKKLQEAIQFSSEDESLVTPPAIKKTVKRQVKSSTKDSKPGKSKRDPLVPKHDNHLPGSQAPTQSPKKISAKKFKTSSSKQTVQLGPSEESNYPDTSSSHGIQCSSSLTSSISSAQSTKSTNKKSSVKNKTPSSLVGSTSRQARKSKKEKSSIKRKTPKKKLAFLNAIEFSSDSEDDNQKMSKSGEHLEYSLKQFIMDSDSEELKTHVERSEQNVIVPESPNLSERQSDDSTNEAFVTIPCSDDVKQKKTPRTKYLLKLAKEFDTESDSSIISITKDRDVLVPDTESPDFNDNSRHDEMRVTVPCSQDGSHSGGSCTKSGENFVTVVKAPSDSSEQSNGYQTYLPNKNSKTFVADSEAVDSHESAKALSNSDNQRVVPDSEATELDKSLKTSKNSKGFILVPDTEDNESEESVKRYQVCVPDSEAIDSYGSHKKSTNEAHVPNRERMQCEDSLQIVDDSNATQCSQLDSTPENGMPTVHASSLQTNTPSLVSRLVSLVRAVSSSPVQTLFGTSPAAQRAQTHNHANPSAAKKLETVFEGKQKSQKPHWTLGKTAGGKKFFELLQYSSDEENPVSDVNRSSDVNSLCDSSQASSHQDALDISNLFERLQKNLSKSTKKKKLVKTAKTKKPSTTNAVPRMTKLPSLSMSDDSSFEKKKSCKSTKGKQNTQRGARYNLDGVNQKIQVQKVLASNSESLTTEVEEVPEICIPDSQEGIFDLQLSVSARSETTAFSQTQEQTVRRITPSTGSSRRTARLPQPPIVEDDDDDDDDYSSEIPFGGPTRFPVVNKSKSTSRQEYRHSQESSTDEFTLEGNKKQTAEFSLQVSMMSPTEQATSSPTEHEESVSKREISLQVSMASSEFDDTLNSENSNEESLHVIQREFSLQVSMGDTEQDDAENSSDEKAINQSANRTDDVFYDTNTDSFTLPRASFSMQVSIAGNSETADAIVVGGDAASHSGVDSDDDFAGGDQYNLLQVSMCNEGRSSHGIPNQADMEGSVVDISSDEQEVSAQPCSSRNSDNNIDDSDADPDFVFPIHKKKISSTTKVPRVKPSRKKTNSGSNSEKNLVEPQTTKTVMLCEKKDVVMGFTEGMEDDYSLPDLSPPKLASTQQQPSADSSEDDFDAYLERLRTPGKPRKAPSRMGDFLVNDDVSTSDDDDDSDDDESSAFHGRPNQDVESSLKTRLGSHSVFKTTNTEPARSVFKTPQPRPSRPTRKTYSKTPGPDKLRQLASTSGNVRSNSTGHSPKFYNFLKSLSKDIPDGHRNPEAKRFVAEFKKKKEELTAKLFKLYNETVFDKKLPENMNIKWNSRLLTTAGFCAYKRDKTTANTRIVRIELSVKVCDTAERVRDTLIHELCHAAVWLVFGKNDGHGRYWQSFAQKATRVHLELPPINRCHVYDINHKFIYKCNKCGQQIGRHTKSLNVEKKVCGICHGRFEVHLNTPQGLAPHTPRTPRTPNKFAIFVKENYKILKDRNAGLKHADVMKALGAEFAVKAKVTA